ncbi:amino acid adenylation domain-containing protein [Amycolatopsis rubida]|uniref:Amino acid adenylation domain-containing protein n=1 Tax=Amycolatopsis rubida TaxID=112413 RepID=A0ABX0BSU1_9PSEU|nr:amino acid adenylation domain-containing protein [Amycolatopsis rubida]NEC58699.1 amino acid adenylation domain-containing protein [Amycolatopsis rubida]
MVAQEISEFAVSPRQRGLWPGSSAPGSSVQMWVSLTGGIDRTRLYSALRAVARRHEALRTSFVSRAGWPEPAQVVGDPAAIELRTAELRDLAELANAERNEIGTGPGEGFRAVLAESGDGPALLLTAHSLNADLRSLYQVATELAAGYRSGEALSRTGAVLQYADFSAWHNDLLAAADDIAERAAWAECLDGSDGGAALRTGAGERSGRPRTYLRDPEPLAAAVDTFAAAHGLDAESVLAAAFEVAVWRVGGESDRLVLLTTPGRSYPALEDAVGPYEREVPFRCEFTADQEFLTVARTAAEWLRSAEHRVDHLDPVLVDRLRAEVLPRFDFREAGELPGTEEPQWTVTRLEQPDTPGPALTCVRSGGTLQTAVRYDPGLLDPATARALADTFAAVLRAGLADGAVRIGAVEILSAAQRESVLEAACGPVVPVPDQAVHELIAERAAQHPARVAVCCADLELSYGELDSRANQLSHYLRASGTARGDKVVVSVGRSPELLVALLGVLKAGAAFVPVDIGYPRARLALAIEQTEPKAVLATGEVLDRLGGCAVPTLALDRQSAEVAGQPETPVGAPVSAEDPAYVLYTSGTTGQPNGVVVPHRGLVNYLSWASAAYRLDQGDGAVVHTSISFDLTLTGLLGPLLVGQRVVLLPESAGITGLAATLRTRRDLTMVKLTPTHLDVLGQLVAADEISGSVNTVVVGGEALRMRSAALFLDAGAETVNEYGPTETVVGATAHRIDESAPRHGMAPIGTPIANARVCLLDPRQRPVPEGAIGEIFIGGAGVAGGYLAQPRLTEERFVADPFGAPGARMYRTGDLARRRADGTLEFLGRSDEQVKIRGVRVELAEIEGVLRAHPGVAHAVVLARQDEDPGGSSPLAGELRLVAYVVPGPGSGTASAALAGYCREQLPEPMVPAAFVVLDALPTTANGKLDRAALPKPAKESGSAVEYVAPRTETEEILAGAVATVLGVDRVGMGDNYFVLGGDSIRSVMVASRAQASGLDVTVATLHDNPVIEDCAAELDRGQPVADPPVTSPFALISVPDRDRLPAEVEDAFPLNLLQEGMIFHRDFAAKSAVYHAIASVRLRAPFDLDVLRTVVRQLVERHPMLRTSFDMTAYSRPLQLVHSEFETPLVFEDLRGLPEPEQEGKVAGWIEREKLRGFELHDYPLIRFMVQLRGDGDFQFTYGFHHEIVDGWSEALMITELFSHYFSLVFDEPIAIKPPKSGMRDAVALELEALARQENYDFWNAYLDGATLMRLPRTGSGPAADKGAREIVRIAVPVPGELSDALKRVATGLAVPLKSVLLAAHLAVMSAYGGNADTLTYTVTNGRPEVADGSTAIGLFVNSLALRVRMDGGSWQRLIEDTLRSERQSMPYRRLPMAELKRHQGNEPLAETLFFFTNYHVFGVLDRWIRRGVAHVANELYGESTFPFCGIFRLNRESGALEVRIEYDSLQFSAEVMESVRDCYVRVLEAIADDPAGRFETLDHLPARDRALLDRFADGGSAPSPRRSLHEAFSAQAAAAPDRIAVESEGGALSYRALDRWAGRIAHGLRRRGIGREDLVGVFAERSPEQIAFLLGVLKAGAAYLPLDPAQPDDRTAAVLAGSGATVVLAQRQLESRIPAAAEPFVPGRDPGPAGGEPAAETDPANAAYVIYTSGSTGEPKGVVVEHRNVLASLQARSAAYEEPVERFLLLSSFAFDSSVAGIFWTLTAGGTLILPPEGAQLDPPAAVAAIARSRPTHTLGIPSLLAPLLDQAGPGELASLVRLITAGEAAPAALARECRSKAPGCLLSNEYGPTEATVWSTVWTGAGDTGSPQLPIGRPVANTRVRALDHHGRIAPVAVAGELHIGGAGVARGYLGDPAATAAVFRPDPDSPAPGSRRYATGDLGRFLPSGDVEFLGRTDQQVKIRGFRVEPAEVEVVLDAHPAVRRSVVIARGEDGDKQLVAYVVPESGEQPAQAELQQYVRDRLPRYLVPSACVVLDAVPLTSTGKVDRARLPEPGPAQELPYTAPQTETEQLLADIWAAVLKLDRVGVRHHFLDVGGESLRAMQVIAATNKLFRIALSVRKLFDAPTIAEFALVVDGARSGAELSGAGPGRGRG